MQYPGYNSGTVILTEGNWFLFRIHNLVQLQDDAYYYVLQDVNGLKHFLPAESYRDYDLKTGDEIYCRIDRINCTGRIFLEPKHPHYSEGETYFFDVIDYTEKESDYTLFVKDLSGNSIEVPLYGNFKSGFIPGNRVQCSVKNIRKAMLSLDLFLPDI